MRPAWMLNPSQVSRSSPRFGLFMGLVPLVPAPWLFPRPNMQAGLTSNSLRTQGKVPASIFITRGSGKCCLADQWIWEQMESKRSKHRICGSQRTQHTVAAKLGEVTRNKCKPTLFSTHKGAVPGTRESNQKGRLMSRPYSSTCNHTLVRKESNPETKRIRVGDLRTPNCNIGRPPRSNTRPKAKHAMSFWGLVGLVIHPSIGISRNIRKFLLLAGALGN